MIVTIEHARKLIEVSKKGLCNGLGTPEPGKMCIMAAISYVVGDPHGDKPTCVHPLVRDFDIRLNDAAWSSNKARAKGMIREGVAKLGSTDIDGLKFASYVSLETVKRIVPIALRAAAKLSPKYAAILEAAAVGCEIVTTLDEAKIATSEAKKAAYASHAAANAASHAAAYAAAYAADAASHAAANAAYAAANAAAYAADAASHAADGKAQARDKVLTLSAEIVTEALIECCSEGSKWLPLLTEELSSF